MSGSRIDNRLDEIQGEIAVLRREMKAEFGADREQKAEERRNARMRSMDRMQAAMNWFTGVTFGLAIALIFTQV
jgi:hypothetical protein